MAHISPFKALRPQPQIAAQIAAPPYDVLSSKEARVAAQGNPNSFLYVTKSEISLPETTDLHSAEVYERAKDNLQTFIKRDLLFRESKPCYYVYRLTMNGRSQTGLVCVSSIADYEANVIRKHEYTRPEKEQDRIMHIASSGAQTGNVFLAYRQVVAIDQLIEGWTESRSPVYDFVTADAIGHQVWIINHDETMAQITRLFETEVPHTYIADGHHRAASAAKVRQGAGQKPFDEGANFFLTTLFPSNQLQIMDYNRVVKDLNRKTPEELLAQIAELFTVAPSAEPVKPQQLHQMGMYLQGKWYRLEAKDNTYPQDETGLLDVSILQNNLLTPILGVGDPRTDKRIDFVGGIRGLTALEEAVNSGDYAIAFSLYPVSIGQLFAIADAHQVMPPKSTWFEPKLRDGLLTHLIYE